MEVINYIGGPGTGKSTLASELFVKMKKENYKVELISEYAKNLTWEKRHNILENDQLYILAKQNRMLERLKDHDIDYVITDSPIIIQIPFTKKGYYKHFFNILLDVWGSYKNHVYFIKRETEYQKYGRNQTEEESIDIDNKILDLLLFYDIDFKIVHISDHKREIFKDLQLSN